MIKKGTVTETNGKYAKVLFMRNSACGENCKACGACEKKHHVSLVLNNLGALKGDTVEVSVSDKTANSALFLIFILPIIIFVFVYCLGFIVFNSHITASLSSVGVVILYAIFIKKSDKKLAPIPEITRIVTIRKD